MWSGKCCFITSPAGLFTWLVKIYRFFFLLKKWFPKWNHFALDNELVQTHQLISQITSSLCVWINLPFDSSYTLNWQCYESKWNVMCMVCSRAHRLLIFTLGFWQMPEQLSFSFSGGVERMRKFAEIRSVYGIGQWAKEIKKKRHKKKIQNRNRIQIFNVARINVIMDAVKLYILCYFFGAVAYLDKFWWNVAAWVCTIFVNG